MAEFERRFIFFSPEDKGYELAIGKMPKGHIEIERKGERLSFKVFIENLREMIYQIQLFTFGGNHVILDEVPIGKDGKREEKYNVNSLNVLNSGIRWQEFDVIVIRPQGPEHSRKVPLVAWLNNSKGGKGEIPFIEDQIREEIQRSEAEYEKPIEIEELVDEGQVGQEIFLEETIEEEINEWQETILDPEEVVEGMEELIQEEYIEEPEEYIENTEELVDGFINETFQEEIFIEEEIPYYYLNQNIQELDKLLTETTPFYPPIKNHRWWEIREGEEALDGFYLYFNGSFVDIRYPYMAYRNTGEIYTDEYKHNLFGLVFNDETEKELGYFVYGIPGRLCSQDQPFQGNTGFLYWHPSEGNQNAGGEMGYWLLYVEAHSGIIAVPKRPTLAPDC